MIRRRRHHPRSREREREELPMKKENRDGREKLFFVVVRRRVSHQKPGLVTEKKTAEQRKKIRIWRLLCFPRRV